MQPIIILIFLMIGSHLVSAVAPGDRVTMTGQFENQLDVPLVGDIILVKVNGCPAVFENEVLPVNAVHGKAMAAIVPEDAKGTIVVTASFVGVVGASLSLAVPVTSRADCNRDLAVDVADLVEVVLAWGSDDVLADVNQDGVVDISDLVEVFLGWD